MKPDFLIEFERLGIDFAYVAGSDTTSIVAGNVNNGVFVSNLVDSPVLPIDWAILIDSFYKEKYGRK